MSATVLILVVTLSAVQSAPDRTCLLAGVDRTKTSSSTCLSCHDGTAGPAIALHVAGGCGTHPVGVRYATERPFLALRPQGPRDPLVVLPDGRVECVTCHSGLGTGPHRTVATLGVLCTGCHDK